MVITSSFSFTIDLLKPLSSRFEPTFINMSSPSTPNNHPSLLVPMTNVSFSISTIKFDKGDSKSSNDFLNISPNHLE